MPFPGGKLSPSTTAASSAVGPRRHGRTSAYEEKEEGLARLEHSHTLGDPPTAPVQVFLFGQRVLDTIFVVLTQVERRTAKTKSTVATGGRYGISAPARIGRIERPKVQSVEKKEVGV